MESDGRRNRRVVLEQRHYRVLLAHLQFCAEGGGHAGVAVGPVAWTQAVHGSHDRAAANLTCWKLCALNSGLLPCGVVTPCILAHLQTRGLHYSFIYIMSCMGKYAALPLFTVLVSVMHVDTILPLPSLACVMKPSSCSGI
jgi:hypothetical protein